MILRTTNKFQTLITTELKESLPKEVWDSLIDYIDSIQFIQNLIAPEEVRGYAKDLQRWENPNEDEDEFRIPDINGRIRPDLTNPHILEDMDFFRERALFYERNKCYTHIRPNSAPRSEYRLFWKEEERRWKEGLTRPSDGEWIPGYYYFYLNYCQIWLNEAVDDNAQKKNKRVKGTRKKEFPKIWLGDYLWFHYMERARDNGEHCKLLKKRGCGFSHKFGAITPCSMYVNKGLPNFHLASDKGFLEGEKGVFSKVVSTLDWIASNTPFPKLRLIDTKLEKKIGYKDGVEEVGLLSSVFGISLKDNPDKARGVRGIIIQYEEDGVFPDIEDAWMVNLEATEEGGIVFGTMISGGTGGTDGANFEGSEKMFYGPTAYHIYGVPNVYDKNSNPSNKCGFFWGAYLNRSRCYEETNGEPDVIRALIEVLQDRYIVKHASTDPTAITKRKSEQPITPAEAVMRASGTIYPVADLKDHLDNIKMQGSKFFDGHYIGDLINKDGIIKWQVNQNKYPIRTYRVPPDNMDGAIEIFEMPKLGRNNSPIKGRYIGNADPYDDDTGTSLGSCFIFDLFTDTIVAEYTGRPKFANDFYEIYRRLGMFYDAELLYENNKKGLYAYFTLQNSLYLLAQNPQILTDQNMMKKGNYGNKNYGYHATEQINAFARRLQRDWLLTMADSAYQETDENGTIISEKLNLHLIRSTAYLEELITWNPDGNFDRESAMAGIMILREEKKRFLDKYMDNANPTKSVVNDDYFTKNYDIKHGKGFSYEETQKLMKQYFSKP